MNKINKLNRDLQKFTKEFEFLFRKVTNSVRNKEELVHDCLSAKSGQPEIAILGLKMAMFEWLNVRICENRFTYVKREGEEIEVLSKIYKRLIWRVKPYLYKVGKTYIAKCRLSFGKYSPGMKKGSKKKSIPRVEYPFSE